MPATRDAWGGSSSGPLSRRSRRRSRRIGHGRVRQLALCRPGGSATRLPPGYAREDFVPLKDVALHILHWGGSEPAILAIHGSAGMAHNFGALAERVAPRFRLLGVDLRGHGFSDKPPSGYYLRRHIEDMCQLIPALNLRRPVLL